MCKNRKMLVTFFRDEISIFRQFHVIPRRKLVLKTVFCVLNVKNTKMTAYFHQKSTFSTFLIFLKKLIRGHGFTHFFTPKLFFHIFTKNNHFKPFLHAFYE